MEEEDYDYFRDIARSSYADMLHDHERNELYYKAIKLAVKTMHKRENKAIVLDIGTGTGLLSMMAAKAGADKITAIEMYRPMARVAKEIIAANGFTNITVINKHSTEVTVGPDGDMAEKANILITELFDTELIGEGALIAYQHAHDNLLERCTIAVPHSARIFAQVVESKKMLSWYKLNPIHIQTKDDKEVIMPHPNMARCPGVPAVHDIQLSEFPEHDLTPLTNPFHIMEFQWGNHNITNDNRKFIQLAKVTKTGTAQIIISWWDLYMDPMKNMVLTTAPKWRQNKTEDVPWRDHWIQSIYSLPKEVSVVENDTLCVVGSHDDYSLWWDAYKNIDECKSGISSRPFCTYPAKLLWSRPRMGMLNDEKRTNLWIQSIKSCGIKHDGICFCIGDMTLLPLLIAKIYKSCLVNSCEPNKIGFDALNDLLVHNKIKNATIFNFEPEEIINKDLKFEKLDLLITEPFFSQTVLPWDDLRFWKIRSMLKNFIDKDTVIMPCKARLCMVPVQFKDLWKIRAPIKNVLGYDVSLMDKMICDALERKENHICEPHAVWEYPCKLLAQPQEVLCFDFKKCMPEDNIKCKGSIKLDRYKEDGRCNGIVLWMEYDLDSNGKFRYSTGIEKTVNGNENYKWSMHHKQAVFFTEHVFKHKINEFSYELLYHPENGYMETIFL